MDMMKKLLTVEQAAKLAGVGVSTIRNWHRAGKLPEAGRKMIKGRERILFSRDAVKGLSSVNCALCGKTFQQAKAGQTYCSDACRKKAHRMKQADENEEQAKESPPEQEEAPTPEAPEPLDPEMMLEPDSPTTAITQVLAKSWLEASAVAESGKDAETETEPTEETESDEVPEPESAAPEEPEPDAEPATEEVAAEELPESEEPAPEPEHPAPEPEPEPQPSPEPEPVPAGPPPREPTSAPVRPPPGPVLPAYLDDRIAELKRRAEELNARLDQALARIRRRGE